jgi:hypothetical protein
MSGRVFKDGNLYGVILTQYEMDLIVTLVGSHVAAGDSETLYNKLAPYKESSLELQISPVNQTCLCVIDEQRDQKREEYEAELNEIGETRGF